ncbi:MAG: hypothetical protein Q8Q14_07350 [Gemmatimonadales bacterium]|nr:hypothetical protein [Gemmatimonadales bacterium]
MMPRYAVMPRFPYGTASYPSPAADPFARFQNRLPTGFARGFGAFGQELPLPPEPPEPPTVPGTPSTGFPGTFALTLILGGAAAAAIGWHMGSPMTTIVGGGALAWGVVSFPYRETVRYTTGW